MGKCNCSFKTFRQAETFEIVRKKWEAIINSSKCRLLYAETFQVLAFLRTFPSRILFFRASRGLFTITTFPSHPPNVQLSSPFYMVWKYLCNIVFTVGYTQSKHENLRPLRLLLLLSRGRQRASHFRLFQDSCKEAHQPPRLLLRSLARLLFLLSLCKFPSVDDWRPRLPKRGRTAPRSPSTCSSLHQ